MRRSAWLACLLVPVLYLAAIYLRQPDDRLRGPEGQPPTRHRLIYDDYDATAYALRGLNAWLGRPPGRFQEPTPYTPLDFAVLVQTAPSIGRERMPFFLEYPTVTLWLFEIPFALPPAVSPGSVSQALADGWHTNVVEHDPQTGLERFLWRKLRFAVRTYEAIGIAALIALMVVIGRGYGELSQHPEKTQDYESRSWTAILLLLPASLYFSANRFDVLPALLVACSLAALGRDRPALSGSLLAMATLVKVYPVCIALVIFMAFCRDSRRVGRWLAAFVTTGVLVLLATIPQFGWAGWWAPYWYQFNRTQDSYDASFYGVLWPAPLASNSIGGKLFRLGAVLGALILAIWSRPRRMNDVLRSSAAVLIVLVSVQAFYSPQWILWLAPLLLPLGQRHPIFAAGYGLLDVITYLTFPLVSDWPMSSARAYCLDGLVWARAIVLCALLVALIAGQWRSRYRMAPSD
jgi:hypothetical protein